MYKNNVISTRNERLTSGFGMRPNPTGAGSEQHNGADFVDAQNLQLTQDVGIIAIADGRVVEVINGSLVGWTVAIAHEGKILSRYQHMKNNSVRVKVGDAVKKGQTLGIMGTTGRSTGIHLHLGVKENSTAFNNGVWVDPLPYMRGEKSIGGNPVIPPPTPVAPPTPNAGLKAGDTVRLAENATYYGGQPIPAWVRNQNWIVRSVSGDRAIIDKNVAGTNAINSPVNIRFLIRV